MKRVVGIVLFMSVFMSLLLGSCTKEAVVPTFAGKKPHALITPGPIIRKPLWPDSLQGPVIPKPLLPKIPWVLSQCIGSYEELVSLLGTNRVMAKAVVLENGEIISLSENLAAIVYTATANRTGSSLFNSQLALEWRRDASEHWQGHFSEVWSLGCVYPHAATGSFTNLKKGNLIIEINTAIYWGAMPYQGLHIRYIVLE